MKKNQNLNIGDLVLVYEGTETFIDGALAKILDRDPDDGSYIVAPLDAIITTNGDVSKLLKHHAKWVKEENFKKILFSREKNSKIKTVAKLTGLLLCFGLIGFLIGYGL